MSAVRFAPTPATVADLLRRRLLALDYPSFARCICTLLESLGYEEARPSGRREWKGYNRPGGGGYDLEASLPGGLAPRRLVAQIKQYDGLVVHQRSVDELVGACLRAGASEALLVTTSAFSEVVLRHAASANPSGVPGAGITVAPVRLIDGQELIALLIRNRIGIREQIRGTTCRLHIDEAFFKKLAEPEIRLTNLENGPSSRRSHPTLPGRQAVPKWRITVRIFRHPYSQAKSGGPSTGTWTGDIDMGEINMKGGG